ncbi:MAG: hypothetical protein ACREDK_05905 [Thermoplasmata archaeon]
MRPGLVALGVALLVLGCATVAAVYLLPEPSPSSEQTTVLQPVFVAAHGGGQGRVTGVDTSTGTLNVHWSSSVPLAVTFYDAPGCPTSGACDLSAPLASWSSNTSGDWTSTGALAFPYVLVWSDPGGSAGSFEAQAVESYHVGGALPAVTALLIDGTAGTLIVIGGIGLFLGLFLRAGIYRPPPAGRRPPVGPPT